MQSNSWQHRQRWALLRLQVIGHLLASPPEGGALQAALKTLAQSTWRHPLSGADVRFGFSTIERWYLRARQHPDPVARLTAHSRADAGAQRAISAEVAAAIRAQYARSPEWTIQLHYDNLKVDAVAQAVPSYPTVRRFFAAHGLHRVVPDRSQRYRQLRRLARIKFYARFTLLPRPSRSVTLSGDKKRSNASRRAAPVSPSKRSTRSFGNCATATGGRNKPRRSAQNRLSTNPLCHHKRQRRTVCADTPRAACTRERRRGVRPETRMLASAITIPTYTRRPRYTTDSGMLCARQSRQHRLSRRGSSSKCWNGKPRGLRA